MRLVSKRVRLGWKCVLMSRALVRVTFRCCARRIMLDNERRVRDRATLWLVHATQPWVVSLWVVSFTSLALGKLQLPFWERVEAGGII